MFLQTDPIRFNAGDVNLYRYCFNNSINLVDPFGLLTKEQCDALRELMAREWKYGTRTAARMSSNTWGDGLLWSFSTDQGGPSKNVNTAEGELDVDWFVDIVGVSPPGASAAAYIGGKLLWNITRLIKGEGMGNPIPFQDPGERTAVKLNDLGFDFGNVFNSDFMKKECCDK